MIKYNIAGDKISEKELNRFDKIDKSEYKKARKKIRLLGEKILEKKMVMEIKDVETDEIIFSTNINHPDGYYSYIINSKVDFKLTPNFTSCKYTKESKLFLKYFEAINQLALTHKKLK